MVRSAHPQLDVQAVESLAGARAALTGVALVAVALDIHLEDGSGLELLREMRARGDDTDVVVITGDADVGYLEEITGLRGQLMFKPASPATLLAYVAQSIERPRTDRLAVGLLAIEHDLTVREAEFLSSLVAASRSEVADAMDITERTAKAHIASMSAKLAVQGVPALLRAVAARRRGERSFRT